MVIDPEAAVAAPLIAIVVFCWVAWLYRKPSRRGERQAMAEIQPEPVPLAVASE